MEQPQVVKIDNCIELKLNEKYLLKNRDQSSNEFKITFLKVQKGKKDLKYL